MNKRGKGLLCRNATLEKTVGAKANEFERTALFGGNYKARRKEIAGGEATQKSGPYPGGLSRQALQSRLDFIQQVMASH